jgi:hypothetical protein
MHSKKYSSAISSLITIAGTRSQRSDRYHVGFKFTAKQTLHLQSPRLVARNPVSRSPAAPRSPDVLWWNLVGHYPTDEQNRRDHGKRQTREVRRA